MRILTVAMQVPDSRASITVAADGSGIETAGLKLVCNPFDEFAVEQAVRLKEGRADVEEVVVLTAGDASASQVLRTALAMGADRAIHLLGDDLPHHDEIAMARLLAATIRHAGVEAHLVLCGKQIIVNDSGELGPALAEFLGLPHIGAATSLELDEAGSSLRARRRVEGAEEVLEGALPMVLTCDKGLVEPRYPSLPNLMKAKKKPVETIAPADLPAAATVTPKTRFVRLEPPAARPPCRLIEGEPREMARELVRLLREEAKVV
ncbi:MAG: electron transfer flavoprotein subunit beta/FixA family protein [Planctomycetota bacterium]|jgi:electron transfer flavoprotein beta subunit